MATLTLGNKPLTNVTNPTNAQDAATKTYVDTAAKFNQVVLNEGVTPLSLNNKSLTNVLNPINAQDAATKTYVDTNSKFN